MLSVTMRCDKAVNDHVTLGVSDIARSKAFYDAALRTLGIERLYMKANALPDTAKTGRRSFGLARELRN
jgi:catechol 2,3-dioxygenase-like lactoylglutathione lyase family enzyme